MVELELLEGRARRAAEWGRARMASRIGGLVLPIVGLSVLAGGTVGACVGIGSVLFGAAASLRFWHREGVDAVRLGLSMGIVPLAAALTLRTCGVECAPWTGFGEAELVCVLAGVIAGAGVTLWASREAATFRTWALATGVAAGTAVLGCVGLGVGGLLVTVAALLASSAALLVPLRGRLA